jgi:glycosyltransferase involved in cell wall biosynthesis
MRILLANYRYFISGGPERYMFNVTEALAANGHEVIPFSIRYTRNHSTPYSKYFAEPLSNADEVYFREQRKNPNTVIRTLERLFYATDVEHAVGQLEEDTKPDIAYVLHYLRKLSPSLLVALKRAHVPIVVRLSDYAMICPQAHLLRDELPCELCVQGNLWPSIRNRCVQGSAIMSALNALATWYHKRRHYFDLIDAFVTTNPFMYRMMISAGFNKERLHCIPTFVNQRVFTSGSVDRNERTTIVYIGRLERIKGVHVLIEALALVHRERPNLKIHAIIAGSGDEEFTRFLKSLSHQRGIDDVCDFVGELGAQELSDLLRQGLVSVIPSLWYENLPNALLESYACGTPILASDLGSLTDCVRIGETGFLFKPGDASDLAEQLIFCLEHPDKLKYMGSMAKRYALSKYTSEAHISELVNLFDQLILDRYS